MKMWSLAGLVVATLTALLVSVPPPPPADAATGTPAAVDIEFTANDSGYYVLDSYGRVTTFGSAPYFGGSPSLRTTERAVSISPTPSGQGYWIFTDLGRVFTYGDAQHFGDLDGVALAGPVLDSVPTPSGLGYYMLGDDGGTFAFGDAGFFGSIPGVLPAGTQLDGKIVGIAPTPTGLGYWLVAEDGGMFAFGDAVFFGSIPGVLAPGTKLAKPVVGMVPQGQGYLMVAADGGIFSFGQAAFFGSIPGLADPGARVQTTAQEVVAVMVRSDNSGYIMLGGNGQTWAFGAAQALGTSDVSTPANPGDSVNCGDFATQVEAQRWHDNLFPFYGDVANLDSDGDGEVCESLVASPAQKLVSADGNLSVDVPEGAAPPGVTVTIETAPAATFGPNQVGTAYRLGPDGTVFSGPVTIKLRVASLPANVRSQSLQLGLRSTGGEITGLSTFLAPHPDGGFELTSATSHFTDVGVLPDSLPLDAGLMKLMCTNNGGTPFDCTKGPLFLEVGDELAIERTGGLTGAGPLNTVSSSPDDVSLIGNTGIGCERAGTSFLSVGAASVPNGFPVQPFTHLLVSCVPPDSVGGFFATSPGLPNGVGAPRVDSIFVGIDSNGDYEVVVQPGAPTGPNSFGALFLNNPTTGNVDALTSRGEYHTGPNIGDVSGQVFNNQNGMPLPPGNSVQNTSNDIRFALAAIFAEQDIIRVENTGSQGFDSDPFSTKVAFSLAELINGTSGGQTTPCVASANTLCLQGDRFKVDVDWDDGAKSGAGTAIDSGHEGGFYAFSNPNDIEMVVRVIDGCSGANSRYWVFVSASTNVEYELTVTDTSTGAFVQYQNELGVPAPAILDTSAFATCP